MIQTAQLLARAALPTALLVTALLPDSARGQAANSGSGAVFVASNNEKSNTVVMLRRARNGKLDRIGQFATGGRGQGGINDPMQSSGSVVLSPDRSFLLVVNAGTSDISVFKLLDNGLALVSVTPSGGGNPISLAIHDNVVYALNFGGSSYHTAGFHLQPWGDLQPIKGSRKHLSTLDTEPSTIAFSPDGSKLVVSERQTNKIDVFSVASDGSLSEATVNSSVGTEPFGLTFTESGTLLVTNAAGSLSSYLVNADNSLTTLSGQSPSSGAATCWVATDGRYAWVTNAASSTISQYALNAGGTLNSLGVIRAEAATEPTIFPPISPPTAFPIDLGLSQDDKYLFVLFSARGSVISYRIDKDGTLTPVDEARAFNPQSGSQGLAAY